MNEESFSWMKDNSYIINIARGSLIDEKALFEALRSGKLAGAAIDPWREHNRREDNSYPCPYPIHHFNVIMTPKCSGTCSEKIGRGKRFAVDNIRRFAEGKEPLHAADISACY
jgi:lactate dehydrogenase-like 2-hydroxyacid dehydrogenase